LEQWAFHRYHLHLGWTNIVGLLFVTLYFYIFIQQRFRADGILSPNLHKALFIGSNRRLSKKTKQ
jgi:hypothetical protein